MITGKVTKTMLNIIMMIMPIFLSTKLGALCQRILSINGPAGEIMIIMIIFTIFVITNIMNIIMAMRWEGVLALS